MGHYYEAIVLGEKPAENESETIRAFVDSGTIPIAPGCQWGHGSKLTEHSGFGSGYVRAVEALLAPGRMFYRSRLVWAGDYADCEPTPTKTATDTAETATATAETATATAETATTTADTTATAEESSDTVWETESESAETTAETGKNLHRMVVDELEMAYEMKKTGRPFYSRMLVPVPREEHYQYVVNHTKRLYVDTTRVGEKPAMCYNNCRQHPLPLLVAEGNDRGGGDYGAHNNDFELCGTWARDVISVNDVMPSGFGELICNFWD